MTWKMPIRTIFSGDMRSIRWPIKVMEPSATLPSSDLKQSGNGLQGGGFPGAVAAQDGHDLTFLDLKGKALQYQDDVVINDFDVVDDQ